TRRLPPASATVLRRCKPPGPLSSPAGSQLQSAMPSPPGLSRDGLRAGPSANLPAGLPVGPLCAPLVATPVPAATLSCSTPAPPLLSPPPKPLFHPGAAGGKFGQPPPPAPRNPPASARPFLPAPPGPPPQ